MEPVFVGSWGYSIDFTSQIDLTAMTAMRMLISRPYGPPAIYDYLVGEFNTVEVGGTLSYMLRATDLPMKGDYQFQMLARNAISEVPFKPFLLSVEPRVAVVAWP